MNKLISVITKLKNDSTIGHLEKLISAVGALAGMALLFLISELSISGIGHYFVISSMAASAVLLFAVPHGSMSQPWPLLGGHVISAITGVTCAHYLKDPTLAAPIVIAISIIAMHYLHCMHPPGGATALTAVIGGPEIFSLGYSFVIYPVLISAVVIMLVAILINYFFPWRRYPASLAKQVQIKRDETTDLSLISHQDLNYALKEMGSLIDVTEEDLQRIYQLALQHAQQREEIRSNEIGNTPHSILRTDPSIHSTLPSSRQQ